MKDNLFRGTYEKRPVNVDLPFEGGDGKRLGGDLVRLGGTEEGGGDAEAGDEEDNGILGGASLSNGEGYVNLNCA